LFILIRYQNFHLSNYIHIDTICIFIKLKSDSNLIINSTISITIATNMHEHQGGCNCSCNSKKLYATDYTHPDLTFRLDGKEIMQKRSYILNGTKTNQQLNK
jgi:hypothetical protein